MTTLKDVQRALLARGYDIGKGRDDGLPGPATYGAMLRALNEHVPLPIAVQPPPVAAPIGIVPMAWMPWARMERIIVHWPVGRHQASVTDRKHYHVLIEGEGNLVRGVHPISDNQSAADGVYAAHVLGLNTGSIAVALCGMLGAKESPFDAGPFPILRKQWETLPLVLADLCRRYAIPVTMQTVLTHAEVQPTLGVKQRGKWDITRLPWDPATRGALVVGNQMRAAVSAAL